MNGKGDKPRPFSVDQETFGNNWDRIFKKETKPEMWEHLCKHDGPMSIQKGEPCNWCGETEE